MREGLVPLGRLPRPVPPLEHRQGALDPRAVARTGSQVCVTAQNVSAQAFLRLSRVSFTNRDETIPLICVFFFCLKDGVVKKTPEKARPFESFVS